ncbi:MAG: CCA tRNA nucleotidyltransferase [Proteobacteria bacterium]|nr:CCA tRNA nucleotidyltransferase [Pseudomonadota bacterium]
MNSNLISEKFNKLCSKETLEFFEFISLVSDKHKIKSYLVGGAVRDILLDVPSSDFDFVVEGRAIDFVDKLLSESKDYYFAKKIEVKTVSFVKYGTLKLSFSPALPGNIEVVDFASMRSETYPQPGGTPQVEPGDLQQDLARRDFSINAMAIEFSRNYEHVDKFSGQMDLQNKQLRVLHPQSFIDDPARLIRACRMIVRYGLKMEQATESLFLEAVDNKYLSTLPTLRLFSEFKKVLLEDSYLQILEELEEKSLLPQILRSYTLPTSEVSISRWEKRLYNLISPKSERDFENILQNFSLGRKDIIKIVKAIKE